MRTRQRFKEPACMNVPKRSGNACALQHFSPNPNARLEEILDPQSQTLNPKPLEAILDPQS